ncbi:MAG: acetolactate synthase large subunit [Mesorhizobium sp.]|nr:MAG: acetolactate synthase large subunit [Mesorhizobium sp.]
MNGAASLVQTLVNSGVAVCFANPGTSEMHFVGALDANKGIRCILCLFEGVASAAADGYARMSGRPAATLLHLGPGLANAGANLHNAMRAGSPLINIVGEHAAAHRHLDAPLTSNIEGLAHTWSKWVRTGRSAASIALDAAEAVEKAHEGGGGIATLILPADTAWGDAVGASTARPARQLAIAHEDRIRAIAAVLRAGEHTALVMNHSVLACPAALEDADRIAQATGAELFADTSFTKIEAGAGRIAIEPVPYPVDSAVRRLARLRHCILVQADEPVGFFAYPGKPGRLLPSQCKTHMFAHRNEDGPGSLRRLVFALGAEGIEPRLQKAGAARAVPQGRLTPEAIGASLANRLPAGAVVSDEGLTAGGVVVEALADAAPHTRLQLTGGAIGIGLPLALGAAVACPDRKVIALQADGSSMYTIQALWTYARENLDIISIILSNRSYAILRHELRNVGVTDPGPKALGMTSLQNPDIDFAALASAMGVPAGKATTGSEFDTLLARAISGRGPFLIEADLA